MTFSVTMKRILDEKIRRLAEHSPQSDAATAFWTDLSEVVKALSESPVESGEVLYGHKHVKLREYVAVFGPLATQYAVNEETQAVFITRLTISGKHPYPSEFEEALNKEPF